MLTLPDNVVSYKKTPDFTAETVPAGLLKDHSTKSGTWGVLTVEKGVVEYTITEPGYEGRHQLDSSTPGVISPLHKHHISAEGDVKFHVTFYREG